MTVDKIKSPGGGGIRIEARAVKRRSDKGVKLYRQALEDVVENNHRSCTHIGRHGENHPFPLYQRPI
jgi:hypothetical protein